MAADGARRLRKTTGPQSKDAVDSAGGPQLSELVRYYDPETKQTWCGFGRPPNWIRGKDREKYRVR